MRYLQVVFSTTEQDKKDVLTALLADAGFEGFEERDDALVAFVDEAHTDAGLLEDMADQLGVTYTSELVEQQNWNALWESNFEPVIVPGICTIRAHFHDIEVTTPYEIQITPKMSFGTGHHATTQLVLTMMNEVDFKGKEVFDFGTGTGVLAILAEMMGATHVLAIDNDEWSVENATENCLRNGCTRISVRQGSLEDVSEHRAEVILANINRHILLQYMNGLYAMLANGGLILMSGLLTDDERIITDAATDAGFEWIRTQEHNNWIAIMFRKG